MAMRRTSSSPHPSGGIMPGGNTARTSPRPREGLKPRSPWWVRTPRQSEARIRHSERSEESLAKSRQPSADTCQASLCFRIHAS
ncbi:MAG: hypothetical protein KatS3mg059_0422 [Thermomicrobiales bacterium]|nr:MAG: hypothetical protein KatS3mg059_0422 [Thermomicrobiales bacterium]